jgi:hypothetical protein
MVQHARSAAAGWPPRFLLFPLTLRPWAGQRVLVAPLHLSASRFLLDLKANQDMAQDTAVLVAHTNAAGKSLWALFISQSQRR